MIVPVLLLLVAADDAAVDASDAEPAAQRRAVTLFPLVAEGAVTGKQAKGVTAQVRAATEALEREGALRLLPTTKEDDAVLRRCADAASCWEDVAKLRGADRLARGSVAPAAEGGLFVRLVVVPGDQASQAVLTGGDGDAQALDRLVREAFAEDTLRGRLVVQGQAGDEVVVDGRRRGAVGEDGELVIDRLREGRHEVVVTRAISRNGTAYEPFSREVSVRHAEDTRLKVTLLPKETTAALGGSETTSSTDPPVAAMVTVGGGAVLVAGGAVCGALSLLDALEVEQRAEEQQLVFPRDRELVTRGATLAVIADVLYGAGAAAIGGGIAWWILSTSPEDGATAPLVGGAR